MRTYHVFRCHVGAYDPVRRTYRTWTAGCTCSWRSEEVSNRTLLRPLWRAHIDALRAVTQ